MKVGVRNDFRTVDLTLPPRPKHTFLMSNFFDFLLPGMPFPKKKNQHEEFYAITRVNK